jgi:ATP-dependent RNA helicase SUPV3L1/SUV3
MSSLLAVGSPAPTPAGNVVGAAEVVGFAAVRERLGVSGADLHTAIALGLVARDRRGRISADEAKRIGVDWPTIAREVRLEDRLNAPDAAALLAVPIGVFRRAVKDGLVSPIEHRHWRWGSYPRYRIRDLRAAEAAILASDTRREARAQAGERRVVATAARSSAEAAVRAAVAVSLPLRRTPTRLVAHLGPTNSGKTHDALAALAAAGFGTYAAPLRMMAQEAYVRLAALAGEDQVGLITGEERINAGAPIIAATTEMVDRRRAGVLVLDEAHWVADPERGAAWTRLLLGAEADELRIVGSSDVLPLLAQAVPGALVHRHQRFVPLDWIGAVQLAQVKPGTIVIAFSRKAVYALARELRTHRRGRVGVLYGALPLASRRRVIADFMAGKLEVLVATDVLGHGVNLPARTILFAETTKFDGIARRNLEPWEVAQIAGRAGRFGFHEAGEVGLLAGVAWATPAAKVVRRGLTPAIALGRWPLGPAGAMLDPGAQLAGAIALGAIGPTGQTNGEAAPSTSVEADLEFGFRAIRAAHFGPAAEDFEAFAPPLWPAALAGWRQLATDFARAQPWLVVADTGPMIARLRAIESFLPRLAARDTWSLACAPIDLDRRDGERQTQLLRRLARAVVSEREDLGDLVEVPLEHDSLEALEDLAARAAILRWFSTRFPGAGQLVGSTVAEFEAACARRIDQLVERAIRANRFGLCASCGTACPPWFRQCNPCHFGWDEDESDPDERYVEDWFERRLGR